MFFIDFEEGWIIDDEEFKEMLFSVYLYEDILKNICFDFEILLVFSVVFFGFNEEKDLVEFLGVDLLNV